MTNTTDVTSSLTFGLVFVTIGLLALLNELDVMSFSWRYVVPIVLIVAGLAVIVSSRINARTDGRY